MELLKAERDKLENKVKNTAVNEQEFYLALKDIVEIAQEAEGIFKSSQIEQKRRLLNLIFANLQIKDKKLIFDYTKPFGDFAKGFSYQLWGQKDHILWTEYIPHFAKLTPILDHIDSFSKAGGVLWGLAPA
jgi:hypothetical protein